MEQWGLPNGVGAAILAALVIVTAVFGLNRIVKTLGIFGPIIVVLIIFVAIWTAISGFPHLRKELHSCRYCKYEITQVGDGGILHSSVLAWRICDMWLWLHSIAKIGAWPQYCSLMQLCCFYDSNFAEMQHVCCVP